MDSFNPVFILYIPVLLLAIVLHELAHAVVAYWGGDDTAALQGRITLNPIPHIDLFGTILLPAFLILVGSSFLFGWAKPVPVNPLRLKNSRWNIWVSLAGPAANLSLLILSAVALKVFYVVAGVAGGDIEGAAALTAVESMLKISILMNLILMLFNLLPIPPLDGSHVVMELFFKRSQLMATLYQQAGMFALILIIVLRGPLSYLIAYGLLVVNTGMNAFLGVSLFPLPR